MSKDDKTFLFMLVALNVVAVIAYLVGYSEGQESLAFTIPDCTFEVDPNDSIGLDEWSLTIKDCNFIDPTDTTGGIKF